MNGKHKKIKNKNKERNNKRKSESKRAIQKDERERQKRNKEKSDRLDFTVPLACRLKETPFSINLSKSGFICFSLLLSACSGKKTKEGIVFYHFHKTLYFISCNDRIMKIQTRANFSCEFIDFIHSFVHLYIPSMVP